MHEHDTTHRTGQTSGSMVSGSRPGPPTVEPPELIAVASFEGPPLVVSAHWFNAVRPSVSVVLCALPALPIYLSKVVLPVVSLWCE